MGKIGCCVGGMTRLVGTVARGQLKNHDKFPKAIFMLPSRGFRTFPTMFDTKDYYVPPPNKTQVRDPNLWNEADRQYFEPDFEDDWEFEGNEEDELAKHFVKLNPLQKGLMALGTGLSSFFDPTRAESIAVFGEVTADCALKTMHQKMRADPEGAIILIDKPRINSEDIDIDALSKLPEGTFGREYVKFLRVNNVTPDSRLPVRFIEDPELAYVMQRYREIHDLVHAVTGQPTNMLGEVVVKWIEGIQTGLPMCVLGGVFGATRLRPKQRAKYIKTHLPWAIQVGLTGRPLLNVYFEHHWDTPVYELRQSICPLLNQPPPK